jgi:hypothetical protein
MAAASIQYSEKYFDDVYEYRCVVKERGRRHDAREHPTPFSLCSLALAARLLSAARSAPLRPGGRTRARGDCFFMGRRARPGGRAGARRSRAEEEEDPSLSLSRRPALVHTPSPPPNSFPPPQTLAQRAQARRFAARDRQPPAQEPAARRGASLLSVCPIIDAPPPPLWSDLEVLASAPAAPPRRADLRTLVDLFLRLEVALLRRSSQRAVGGATTASGSRVTLTLPASLPPSPSPKQNNTNRTSGAPWACSRAAAGCTTPSTAPSRTSCCSGALGVNTAQTMRGDAALAAAARRAR